MSSLLSLSDNTPSRSSVYNGRTLHAQLPSPRGAATYGPSTPQNGRVLAGDKKQDKLRVVRPEGMMFRHKVKGRIRMDDRSLLQFNLLSQLLSNPDT